MLGGLGLCLATYARRPPRGEQDFERSRLYARLGCAAIVLAPVLYVFTVLLVMSYEDVWGGRFATPYTIDDMGPVLFVLAYGSPWIQVGLALVGLAAIIGYLSRPELDSPRAE